MELFECKQENENEEYIPGYLLETISWESEAFSDQQQDCALCVCVCVMRLLGAGQEEYRKYIQSEAAAVESAAMGGRDVGKVKKGMKYPSKPSLPYNHQTSHRSVTPKKRKKNTFTQTYTVPTHLRSL